MRRWYFPSWNGDIRIEEHPEDPKKKTLLTVISPTAAEIKKLGEIDMLVRKRGWRDRDKPMVGSFSVNWPERAEFMLDAPVSRIGKVLLKKVKGGKQTLTAVVFEDGTQEVADGDGEAVAALVDTEAEGKEPEKAVSVKRPTPCCPTCFTEDPITAADEVLKEFLTPSEWETWVSDLAVYAYGGMSGHLYRIAHRQSPEAARQRKICLDLTNGEVLHFHDWSVPPAEEVLASKLILEHREDWLRNEATLASRPCYKNPFGDGSDGIPDSRVTANVGAFLEGMCLMLGVGEPKKEADQ